MKDYLIKTDNLKLREFKTSDFQSTYSYASDSEVVKYMDWGPSRPEDTQRFIDEVIGLQGQNPRRDYELAIILAKDNRHIGGGGIHVSNVKNREGWIGYCLNKDYWGRGFGTETAKALISFGFSQLGLHRIYATCDPANRGSARVLEKAEMTLEGIMRQHKLKGTQWRDSCLYAILETDVNK